MQKLGITPVEKFGKIRLSEVFLSVQGEGPKTGQPTTFFRTAGCNVRCPGWAVETTLPNGRVVTGCDSPHSVFPEIYKLPGGSTLLEPHEAVERIPEYPRNICLTGGEPLLQKKALTPWLKEVLDQGHTVEVFTNGTIELPHEDEVWTQHPDVSYVMDFKPYWSGVTLPFNEKNFSLLREQDSIKFVCKNHDDFLQALGVIDEHPEFKGTWLIGVVYGVLSPVTLIEWMIKEQRPNLNLNLQTQQLISDEKGESFDEGERTLSKVV